MERKKKMTLFIIGIVLIVAAIGVFAFWHGTSDGSALISRIFPIFGGCNPPLPRESLTIGTTTWSVEIASTTVQKACGLSGRKGLGEDEGMIFFFGSSSIQNFWMKDMNFPLDMVWINGTSVVGFAQNAVPQPGASLWSLKIYSSPSGADKVLEVNAGTVEKYGIKVGDAVKIGN